MVYLMFLAGLYLGGDALIGGASGVARAPRLPPLLIGRLPRAAGWAALAGYLGYLTLAT